MLFMPPARMLWRRTSVGNRAVDAGHAADTVEREAVAELDRRQLDGHEDEERKALHAARQSGVEQTNRRDGTIVSSCRMPA